jgi:hypothetical protein
LAEWWSLRVDLHLPRCDHVVWSDRQGSSARMTFDIAASSRAIEFARAVFTAEKGNMI